MPLSFADPADHASAVPIRFVHAQTLETELAQLPPDQQSFARAAGFAARPGQIQLLPGSAGVACVLFGLETPEASFRDPFRPGVLAGALPAAAYRFANSPYDSRLAALAFLLGAYRFRRYKNADDLTAPCLVPPDGCDADELMTLANAVALARDMINTPANDMGPGEIEAAVRALAAEFGASCTSTIGDALLSANLPLIHAVGRASARAPRLIDLSWGHESHPKITLVGKGVCFDTGGLDLKPESAMLLMKKDMGGAATVLALAHMIMARRLNVRLRVLIPAVENAVGGDAFRPLDIYRSRKGLSVEIGNTDAEGRLVLADALALADEDNPDLLIDLGTLTGAARVALGPDLPPFYTSDEDLARDLSACALREHDPLWRLPLWMPYDSGLDSKVADVNNIASGGFAGSIICALFLKRFVRPQTRWLHLDIYGWTPSAKPACPEGGECQAARAIFALLAQRYA